MSVLLRAFTISLFLALVSPLVVSAQSVDAPATDSVTVLTVGGDLTKSVDLSMADLLKLPKITYGFHKRSGNSVDAEFDGVTLATLLALVGVKKDDLQEALLDAYLLVESADGNRMVFSLPEIDSDSGCRGVILAFRRDSQMLSESEGPLRLITLDGSRDKRWIKNVRKLTIVRVKVAS